MSEIRELVSYIEDRLNGILQKLEINNEKWFVLQNQEVIHVDMIDTQRLTIEFADNEEDARRHISEDGQAYCIEDYTLEEMFEEMMSEIEYESQTPPA